MASSRPTGLVRRGEALPTVTNKEELDLFKGLIAPPGTPEAQIKLAMVYAQKLGLDPLRKQVMIIETYSKGLKTYQIVIGIHGMGALVARQKDYAGTISSAVYEAERITIDARGMVEHTYDPTKRSGAPLGAWSTTYRMLHGHRIGHTIYLKFDDYVKKNSPTWERMPAWMIEKTARAFTMRAAYPDVLSNVYAPEEFGERSSEQDQEGSLGGRNTFPGDQNPFTPPAQEPAFPSEAGSEADRAPLPWEKEVEVAEYKTICGTCGSDTVKFFGKDGKWWRQCQVAREKFLKDGDREFSHAHYLKEETP
jgi:phage recombination protein Bet